MTQCRGIFLYCIVAAVSGLATVARGQYVDTRSGCILCHQSTPLQNDFCSTTPAAVWLQDDKHRQAFALLHDTEAKRELVRRILGFDLREAFTDDRLLQLNADPAAEVQQKVATVKSCLRCHATWPKEADEKHPHSPPSALDLGVSCQACHGPGEKWDQSHRLKAWRLVTPAAKESLGFADCRSSVAKARLCASCHIGNVAEGKFVKHEWYAAGHPPLPSFELASFESQMPAHWKSLREKGAFGYRDQLPSDDGGEAAGQIAALQRLGVPSEGIKQSYRQANFPDATNFDPASDLARTKDSIVGGAIAFETYVRSAGDYAALAAAGKAAWPELALYDCSACHHELRNNLGRDSRPKRNHVPGRPPLATWPAALARLTAFQSADYEALRAKERWSLVEEPLVQLDRATTSRPFGDPAAMQTAAGPLAAALARLAQDAEKTPFDERAGQRAIRQLTDPNQVETGDFHSARQAAWAIREMASELGVPQANRLFQRGADDPLALTLPSGPNRGVIDNLGRWLPAASNYDVPWLREELKSLRDSLDKN